MDDSWLTAAEAARHLGVRRETLYAYVSRGVLPRLRAVDGRTSRFRLADLEALRARGRPTSGGDHPRNPAGIVTGITLMDPHNPSYRGRPIAELIGTSSFIEVADLLWDQPHDPTAWEPKAHDAAALLPARIVEMSAVDRFMSGLVALVAAGEGRHARSPEAVAATGRRGIAFILGVLGGHPDGAPTKPSAAALAPALARRHVTDRWLEPVEAIMVAMADHELAPSTYAARVAASTRADPYAAVLAAVGTFRGALHGGATAAVHRMLNGATEYDSPSTFADAATAETATQTASTVNTPPGFGHSIYTAVDPRFQALWARCRPLLGAVGDNVDALIERCADRLGTAPNVDLAIGAITAKAKMRPDAGQTIVGAARMAGWLAHIAEEYQAPPLRYRAQATFSGRLPGDVP